MEKKRRTLAKDSLASRCRRANVVKMRRGPGPPQLVAAVVRSCSSSNSIVVVRLNANFLRRGCRQPRVRTSHSYRATAGVKTCVERRRVGRLRFDVFARDPISRMHSRLLRAVRIACVQMSCIA